MNFKKVEMQNFMAIKEAELELENRGLVLIEGINKSNDSFTSNGASKTSLVTAITYALYGRTEKGLKADEVVNNIEKKNTFVKLSFSIGNDNYRIERYRKHSKHKNKVLMFLNDNEITGSTNDVTDAQIQELFGIEFNTYVNAIMYGQGDIPMFSQATDKGKKEILESITKVDVYKKAQDVAKEKVKEVTAKQSSLETHILMKNNDLNHFKEQEEAEQKRAEEQKQRQQEQENIVAGLKAKLETEETSVEAQINALKDKLPSVEEYIHEYSEGYQKASEGLTKTSNKRSTINAKYTEIQHTIRSNENKLRQLDTSDSCPVCGSPIDNSHKVKESENITAENQTLKEALSVLDGHIEKIDHAEKTLKEVIDAEDAEKRSKEQEIQAQYRNQQQHYQEIQRLENSLSALRTQVTSAEAQLASMNTMYTPVDNSMRIEETLAKIEVIKDEILKLEDKKQHYNNAVEAFSNKGIRSVVLDFLTPFLNERANEYLSILSGSDISVEFQTQVTNASGELKDKFDVTVTNSNGGGSYKSNSAGEQRRIDLAISFAIQDLIMDRDDISTNIALYDECFDGLDMIGCENVVKLLKDRLDKVGTIFVITHNEHLKPLFENVITMVKENGVSRLEKEVGHEVKN